MLFVGIGRRRRRSLPLAKEGSRMILKTSAPRHPFFCGMAMKRILGSHQNGPYPAQMRLEDQLVPLVLLLSGFEVDSEGRRLW